MAGRKDIEAGKAVVTVGVRNNLQRGLQAIQRSLQNFSRTANRLGSNFVRLGAAISGPLLAAGLASEKVRSKLDEVRQKLSSALEPAILPIVNGLANIVGRVSEWAERNPKVIQQILAIGVGVTAIGASLKVAAAAAGVLAAALASPLATIGLLAAGAAALWVAFSDDGRAAIRSVGDSFNALVGLIAQGHFEAAWELVLNRVASLWESFQQKLRRGYLRLAEEAGPGGPLAEANRATLRGMIAEGDEKLARLENRYRNLSSLASKWADAQETVTAKIAESAEILRSIQTAEQKRARLVAEFDTQEERDAKKTKELNDARAQLFRNRNVGLIGEEQFHQEDFLLRRAEARHRQQIAERRRAAAEAKRADIPEIPHLPEFRQSARAVGTFSGFAAGRIGGDKVEGHLGRLVGLTKEVRKELADIRRAKGGIFRA